VFGEWLKKAEEALELLRDIRADLRELATEIRQRRKERV
jgi:hypothetical protein